MDIEPLSIDQERRIGSPLLEVPFRPVSTHPFWHDNFRLLYDHTARVLLYGRIV
jgi:hypothetical protein